jgi:hypothetical protein
MKRELNWMSVGLAAVLGLALPGTLLSAMRAEAQTRTTQRSRATTRARTATNRPRTTTPARTKPQPSGTAVGTDPGTSTNTQSATDAQLRTSARARAAANYRVTVRSLLTDMAEMDPQEVRLDLELYRVVQANEVMDATQLGRLTQLVDDNSTARRNRNLITNMLREAQRLTRAQTVVGADLGRRLLFAADNRLVAPAPRSRFP